MVRRWTAVCALAVAACASPESLAPFPCSTEGVCPTQDPNTSHDYLLRCIDGMCRTRELLLPCDTDDDCPTARQRLPPELKRCVKSSCSVRSDFVTFGGACWPGCGARPGLPRRGVVSEHHERHAHLREGRLRPRRHCATASDCGFGHDVTCMRGRCTRVCATATDCRSGEECVRATAGASAGVCAAKCSGGRPCPANTTCTLTGEGSDALWCLPTGVAPGTSCGGATPGTPCGGSLSCGDASSNRCWAPCINGRCATGFVCSDYATKGFCHPECTSSQPARRDELQVPQRELRQRLLLRRAGPPSSARAATLALDLHALTRDREAPRPADAARRGTGDAP